MFREWIIFTICVGIGGHVALGLVLHAPENWTMTEVAWYGLSISLSIYIGVQISRSAWQFLMAKGSKNPNSKVRYPGT